MTNPNQTEVAEEKLRAMSSQLMECVDALEGLVRAVNTNELAAAMACHEIVAFANVEDALKPALAALAKVRDAQIQGGK